MIKTINTIMKKKLFLISILILILLTNKIILSKLILISLEKWIDKKIIVSNFDINYRKKEIYLKGVIIRNKDKSTKKIFTTEEIRVKIKPKTLFSKLIIIENIKFKKPILNLEFKISNNNSELNDDNLGLLENLKNKNKPKIYPDKMIDINFLVINSSIEEFKVNIKRSDNNNIETIFLSNMYFKKFGNELGYRHYKDNFK